MSEVAEPIDPGASIGMAEGTKGVQQEQLPAEGEQKPAAETLRKAESESNVASTDNATIQEGATKSEITDNTDKKVYVHNVLKYLNQRVVNRMTDEWLKKLQVDHPSLLFDKVKKPPKDNWILVTVNSAEFVQPLIDYINSSNLQNKKGGNLYATRATSKRKRDGNNNEESDSRKRQHRDRNAVQTPRDPRDVITPLWRQSYEDQLKSKVKEMVRKSAMKIVQEVKSRFRSIQKEAKRNPQFRKSVKEYDWLRQARPIEVDDIIAAPAIHRNKCEFTFGYRCKTELPESEGDEPKPIPAVGFMASGWSGGVSRPHVCQNIPDEACVVVDIVDLFLSDSPIPPYDVKAHRGVWRYLTVRTSRRTGECMVIICHAPSKGAAGAKDESDDYSEQFLSERDRLVSMLTANELSLKIPRHFEKDETFLGSAGRDQEDLSVKVTSVYFQEYDGLSNPKPEHPVQHAFGKLALQEKLGKCIFQISPGAFFQVNTPGAEKLYNVVIEKIREVAKNPEETLLFDVCCGTGTIGLTALKEGVVGRVVGVDISAPAIEDAKRNAELNGYSSENDSKARFIASRAEHVLGKELKACNSKYIIAVVDPARDGLHQDVVKALRNTDGIQRIVYVSCNPTGSLVKDAGLLCAPATKRYTGLPFKPSSAQPADMFPLTGHCELVVTFDRMSAEE